MGRPADLHVLESLNAGVIRMDDLYEMVGSYGLYQIMQFITMTTLSIGHAGNSAAGYMSMGRLEPDYYCHDSNFTDIGGNMSMTTTMPGYETSSIYPNASTFSNLPVEDYPTEKCRILRTCHNLTTVNRHGFESVYQDLKWACIPTHLPTTIASISMALSAPGYLIGGHLSDYFGRLVTTNFCLTFMAMAVYAISFAPTTTIYFAINIINWMVMTTRSGSTYSLFQESTGPRHRLIHGFAFHWSVGYTIAGLIGYFTREWRLFIATANTVSLPSLLWILIFYQESPRWLIQKKKYARAAKSLNRIAWMNRRSVRFTAEMMERVVLLRKADEEEDDVEMTQMEEEGKTSRRQSIISALSPTHHILKATRKHYTSLVLISNGRLALYTLTQFLVGMVQNLVWVVIMMNIDDLAGDVYFNTSLFGILRLWTPFMVLYLDTSFKKFGRRLLLLLSLAGVNVCFVGMTLIWLLGVWDEYKWLATAMGLTGYAINFGLVWNGNPKNNIRILPKRQFLMRSLLPAYKQYTAELFPTEIRAIALSTLSFLTIIGSILAPQVVMLKQWFFPAPYVAAASISGIAFTVAYFVLPETRGKPLWDTMEELMADIKKEKDLKLKKRNQ